MSSYATTFNGHRWSCAGKKDKKKEWMEDFSKVRRLNKTVKIDFQHVNRISLRPWITERITQLLNGTNDDIVTEYAINQLEGEDKPDGRLMQINLTGFLGNSRARLFISELWQLLISAQSSPGGVPPLILEEAETRLKRQQEREERVKASIEQQEKKLKEEKSEVSQMKKKSMSRWDMKTKINQSKELKSFDLNEKKSIKNNNGNKKSLKYCKKSSSKYDSVHKLPSNGSSESDEEKHSNRQEHHNTRKYRKNGRHSPIDYRHHNYRHSSHERYLYKRRSNYSTDEEMKEKDDEKYRKNSGEYKRKDHHHHSDSSNDEKRRYREKRKKKEKVDCEMKNDEKRRSLSYYSEASSSNSDNDHSSSTISSSDEESLTEMSSDTHQNRQPLIGDNKRQQHRRQRRNLIEIEREKVEDEIIRKRLDGVQLKTTSNVNIKKKNRLHDRTPSTERDSETYEQSKLYNITAGIKRVRKRNHLNDISSTATDDEHSSSRESDTQMARKRLASTVRIDNSISSKILKKPRRAVDYGRMTVYESRSRRYHQQSTHSSQQMRKRKSKEKITPEHSQDRHQSSSSSSRVVESTSQRRLI
ncbi:hypothetical protein SNEBB_000931 [Seison nebaliae]|nr:hypothetical protein SNEBB_000931 [Seison nebaliae]